MIFEIYVGCVSAESTAPSKALGALLTKPYDEKLDAVRQEMARAFLDKLSQIKQYIQLAEEEAQVQVKAKEKLRMRIVAIVLEYAKSRRINIYKDIEYLNSKNFEDLHNYAIKKFPELAESIRKLSANI